MADEVVIPIRGADEDLQKALEQSLGGLERFAKDATEQAKDLAKEIEAAASGASAFGVAGLAAASAAGAAFAVTKLAIEAVVATIQSAVSSVVNFGTTAVSSAAQYRQAIDDMIAVTDRMGNSAAGTADDIRSLAKEIGDSTRFTREQALEAQRLLVQFDRIDGSQFDRTAKAAADLATAMRQDLGSAATMVGKALQHPERAAGLLAKANIELTDAQQIMIHRFRMVGNLASAQEIVLKAVENQYGGLAQQVTENDTAMDRWGDAVEDAKRAIGDALLPVLEMTDPIIDMLSDTVYSLIDAIAEWTAETEDGSSLMQTAIDRVADAYRYVMEIAATAGAVITHAWENMGAVLELVGAKLILAVVGPWEDIRHMFTDTIPTVLRWFADNWRDIFTDVGNFLMTVAENMLANLGSLVANIMNFLRGDPQRFEFVALTEGFESTLRELPVIAERELTGLELAMQEVAGNAMDKLTTGFEDRLQDWRRTLGLVGREVDEATADSERSGRGARAPGLSSRERQPWMTDEEGVSASIEGMTQLQSRIQSAAASTRTAEEREHQQLIAEIERLQAGTKDGLGDLKDGTVGTLEQIKQTDEHGNQILGGILGGINQMNQRLTRLQPSRPGILAE